MSATGLSINHHREGSGPPLVLLHGVGLSWQIGRPVIGILARDFDVIACDSPGFGGSPALPAGIEPTIPAYAERFAQFFAELGIERPHVAGNSMGGAIATRAGQARRRGLGQRDLSGRLLDSRRTTLLPGLAAVAGEPPARAAPGRARRCRHARGAHGAALADVREPVAAARRGAGADLLGAWASPALGPALAAFEHYTFAAADELDGAIPVTIAWGIQDRLLPYRTQAPRARAMLPHATTPLARRRARAVLRRSARRSRGDPHERRLSTRRGRPP